MQLRSWETFLYTLKADPAAGGDAAVTGVPASPFSAAGTDPPR
jgi:hypothetical protein